MSKNLPKTTNQTSIIKANVLEYQEAYQKSTIYQKLPSLLQLQIRFSIMKANVLECQKAWRILNF